ncbi:hypothetical protein KY290_031246 [Solanum tuberosum]|uniref:Uncharacterized protein n=1 Tax=Solanum tuberosum TaxID=4113 RepID=A0ABQ7UAG3_SOLTU|nr:hypothetical protein KY290_031246 [Solanum tuberosum]
MSDPAPRLKKAYSLILAKESQRILGKSNDVGCDNFSLVNEVMAFFSNNKGAMPRSSFNPYSGFNPPLGASARSSHKSSTNSHLYCDYCNLKGHGLLLVIVVLCSIQLNLLRDLTTAHMEALLSGQLLMNMLDQENEKAKAKVNCDNMLALALAHVAHIGSSKVVGDLSSGTMRGIGRMDNDLYVVNVDCLLDKSPRMPLQCTPACVSTANTAST